MIINSTILILEGHGYYDDGEEHLGVAEDEYDRKNTSFSTKRLN